MMCVQKVSLTSKPNKEYNNVNIHFNASFLAFRSLLGRPTLWFLVDPEVQQVQRRFIVIESDFNFNPEQGTQMTYLGTEVFPDGKDLHLFEIKDKTDPH